jgi:cobalamin biosynthesis protein CobW
MTGRHHDNPLEEVYEDQLLAADLVVVNKAELLTPPISRRRERDPRRAPRAVKVIAARGAIDPADRARAHRGPWTISPRVLASRRGGRPPRHDDFETIVVDVAAQRPVSLVTRLKAVAADTRRLRVKGWVEIAASRCGCSSRGSAPALPASLSTALGPRRGARRPSVVIAEKGLDADAVRARFAPEELHAPRRAPGPIARRPRGRRSRPDRRRGAFLSFSTPTRMVASAAEAAGATCRSCCWPRSPTCAT